jgi:hypothetical protein
MDNPFDYRDGIKHKIPWDHEIGGGRGIMIMINTFSKEADIPPRHIIYNY